MMNEFNPDGKDIRFIDSHYLPLVKQPPLLSWLRKEPAIVPEPDLQSFLIFRNS